MNKIHSNVSEEELELIKKQADKLNLTVSAFVNYSTMLIVNKQKAHDFLNNIKQAIDNANTYKSGDNFIIPELFKDKWKNFSSRDKARYSDNIREYIKKNPSKFKILNSGVNSRRNLEIEVL